MSTGKSFRRAYKRGKSFLPRNKVIFTSLSIFFPRSRSMIYTLKVGETAKSRAEKARSKALIWQHVLSPLPSSSQRRACGETSGKGGVPILVSPVRGWAQHGAQLRRCVACIHACTIQPNESDRGRVLRRLTNCVHGEKRPQPQPRALTSRPPGAASVRRLAQYRLVVAYSLHLEPRAALPLPDVHMQRR